jgi:hypothetical protein
MFWSILKLIAFAGIWSRTAATILCRGRVRGLDKGTGRDIPAEFRRPMSRRENTQQRKVLLQPRGTGTHADRHRQCSNAFDLSAWRESGDRMTVASGAIAELRCGSHKSLPSSVVDHSATPHPELVDAHGLLANLVWHRVRPPSRSPADTGPRRPSRSDLESLGKRRSVQPVPTAQAGSLDQSPASIEALFTHLARRRLRSLAHKEKQA